MQEALNYYEIFAACGVMMLGAWVQGSVGFGMAMLSAPILLIIDPRLVPGPIVACSVLMNVAVFLRERHPTKLPLMNWALGAYLVGSVLAGMLIARISVNVFSIFFAVMVILAVVLSACGYAMQQCRRTYLFAGFLSGFMGTMSSIGGPPMALALQNKSGPQLRSSLSLFFIGGASIALVNLYFADRFGIQDMTLAAMFMPAIAIGFLASSKTRGHVDRGNVRPAILALSSIASVVVLIRILA